MSQSATFISPSVSSQYITSANPSACSAAALTTLDSAGTVGAYSSVAVGADGLGLISYYDGTNGDLKAAHCDNLACSSAPLTTRDSAGLVGHFTALRVGAGRRGAMS